LKGIDLNNRKNLKGYMFLIAVLGLTLAISFFIIVTLFDITDYGISIAAIGASIYVIFSNRKVSYRMLFLAYVVAVASGSIAMLFDLPRNLGCTLAFLLSLFVLFFLNLRHTPAVGFAVSTVLHRFNLGTIFLVLGGIFLLFFIAKSVKNIIANPRRYFIEIESPKIDFRFKKKSTPAYFMIQPKKTRI